MMFHPMLIFIDIVLLNFHLLSIQYFFSSAHLGGIYSGYQNYPTSKYNFFSSPYLRLEKSAFHQHVDQSVV